MNKWKRLWAAAGAMALIASTVIGGGTLTVSAGDGHAPDGSGGGTHKAESSNEFDGYKDSRGKIKDVSIVLGIDETKGELHTGDTTTVELVGTYEDGTKTVFGNADISTDGNVLSIENGKLTGLKETDNTRISAMVESGVQDVALHLLTFATRYSDGFDNGGNSTFDGLISEDDYLIVPPEKTSYCKSWVGEKDYSIKAPVVITSKAAGIIFRATSEQDYYFWKFNTEEKQLEKYVYSSKISGGYRLLGTTPLDNIQGENETNNIQLRVDGNVFTTYLNGEEVDVTRDDTLAEGSFGIKSDASESFKLERINAGDLLLMVERMIGVVKPADKSKLSQSIESGRKAIDDGEVEQASLSTQTAFYEAYHAATDVAARPEASQAQINDAIAVLLDSLDKIKSEAKLRNLYNAACALDLNLYETGHSKDAFRQAIADAKAVLDGSNVADDAATAAYNALEDAMNSLILLDKAQLNTDIKAAAKILSEKDKYMAGEAWDTFVAAYEKAVEVQGMTELTNAMIQQAAADLHSAMANLRYKENGGISAPGTGGISAPVTGDNSNTGIYVIGILAASVIIAVTSAVLKKRK